MKFSVLLLAVSLVALLSIPSSSYSQSTSPWLDVGLTLHDFGFSMDNPTPDRLEMVIGLFNDLQKQEDLLFTSSTNYAESDTDELQKQYDELNKKRDEIHSQFGITTPELTASQWNELDKLHKELDRKYKELEKEYDIAISLSDQQVDLINQSYKELDKKYFPKF